MKIGRKITETFTDPNTVISTEYVFDNTLSDGYEDITSVENFIDAGQNEGKDYKWIRKQLQSLDFNTLTDNEKIIVARYKGTNETNCKALLGDEYNKWMTDFDSKSVICRTVRFSYAKTIFLKNVSLMDRYAVLGYLNTIPTLKSNYIYDGIEGTSEGDPIEGFFNFVEATGAYASTGIAVRDFTMLNGATKQNMVETIMDCLRNGNY